MKTKRFAILLGACFAVLVGMVWAADEDVNPVPVAPYLAAVPDYGHWTVTFKYPPEPSTPAAPGASAPAPTPTLPVNKYDIIKTGDMMLVTLTAGSGTPKIFYQRGDWIVTVNPENAQQAQVLVPSPDHLPYPYYTKGFMLMDGMTLGPSNFKGLVKYNNSPAYYYQPKGGEVWISPHSMLPMAVKSSKEGLIAEYQFLQPPPAPFQIPGDQASLLQKEQDAYKAVRSMR